MMKHSRCLIPVKVCVFVPGVATAPSRTSPSIRQGSQYRAKLQWRPRKTKILKTTNPKIKENFPAIIWGRGPRRNP